MTLPRTRWAVFTAILALVATIGACGDEAPSSSAVDGDASAATDAGDAGVDDGGASDAPTPDTDSDPDPRDTGAADAGPTDTGDDAATDPLDDPSDGGIEDGSPDAMPDAGDDATPDTGADADDSGLDAMPDAPPADTGPPPCGPSTPWVELDDLAADEGWRRTVLPRCTRVFVPFLAPLGSRWRVDATALPADTSLLVWTPHYRSIVAGGVGPDPLVRAEAPGIGGSASVEVRPIHGGELIIALERDDRTRDAEIDLRLTCLEGCDRRTTRYPLVLVHGYAGVDSYFGVLEYFFDVVPTLADAGFSAFTPVTDPIERSELRADQLREQVDEILRDTGAARVHILAHSQGGLDARILISRDGYGDRVATLTTIATPHRGIPLRLADFASRHDFSPEFMDTFNRAHPDDERVRYFSWSFRSCRTLQFGCRGDSDGETVDAFLVASHLLLSRFGDNDGVVPTDSMPWGEHLGLRFADHFDEVGQIADRERDGDPFAHRAFYRDEAYRLADLDATTAE